MQTTLLNSSIRGFVLMVVKEKKQWGHYNEMDRSSWEHVCAQKCLSYATIFASRLQQNAPFTCYTWKLLKVSQMPRMFELNVWFILLVP